MKAAISSAAFVGAILASAAPATDKDARDVDTRFPYTGPAVPIGDFVDTTINGNGKGFIRLVEPPAVAPKSANPKNNINVINAAFIPGGLNIHFQTPFGLGDAPSVKYGTSKNHLQYHASGQTSTYDRTPPCSEVKVTQCSQYFHNIQMKNLKSATTYYYQIQASNGTTESQVMSLKTAHEAGDKSAFTVAVLNDMGYTNTKGTHKYLTQAADDGVAFAWHGGDISYADDWYEGILPCEPDWDVCYNGTSTELPNTPPAPYPVEYNAPLKPGEIADQGGPQGGDVSAVYESNWDLWQNWMSSVSTKVPYMVMPGNHEATCAEFDGPNNELTAYLVDDKANSTANSSALTYYSCPPSQRNFTTYQFRFRMPGQESGGVGNFWYSFDYGLAHFVSLDGETDFAYSPEWPFVRDVAGENETLPTEDETFITDSGPFGAIDDNKWKDNTAYQQYQWLKNDLASVDRTKTPWIIAMSHRPMYSSEVSSYQANVRAAFEGLLLEYGADMYLAGHIHWYERIWPIGNKTIDTASIINNNTYQTNPGTSMTHIVNGMAGNIESHSTINSSEVLNITAVLNQLNFGFSKLTFHNETALSWQYIKGVDGSVGDELTLVKKGSKAASGYGKPHGKVSGYWFNNSWFSKW